MAIEVIHLGHTYTYRHPVGWSGGDSRVREELNKHCPASGYPDREAEKMAARHALGGILAGGEAVEAESGRHVLGGRAESDAPISLQGPPAVRPDHILEESSPGNRPPFAASDPDRILEEGGWEGPAGDPDRILDE